MRSGWAERWDEAYAQPARHWSRLSRPLRLLPTRPRLRPVPGLTPCFDSLRSGLSRARPRLQHRARGRHRADRNQAELDRSGQDRSCEAANVSAKPSGPPPRGPAECSGTKSREASSRCSRWPRGWRFGGIGWIFWPLPVPALPQRRVRSGSRSRCSWSSAGLPFPAFLRLITGRDDSG
jgi:hypothetical protein